MNMTPTPRLCCATTHNDYNLGAVYTDRRIIGLPSAEYLYDGNNTLFSKVTYEYDLTQNPIAAS